MYNGEDFLDILGEIDDGIISDAVITKKKKPQRIIIKIIVVSAAVFVFALAGILTKNGDMYITSSIPSKEQTSEEATGTIDSPDITYFIDTDILKLLSAGTDSVPLEYPVIEKKDWDTLQSIYKTKLLPSYLPVSGGNSILTEEEYPVYYNEDKTKVFCENYFSFNLENGDILSIKASTEELPKLPIEEENIYAPSYISGVPVLLFRGEDNGIISIYSAYLQKDGCYFRIQLTGALPEETEFIKIVSSLI